MFWLGLLYQLQGLKQRIEGDSEDVLAPPGITEHQPLHVVMVRSFLLVSLFVNELWNAAEVSTQKKFLIKAQGEALMI